MSVRVRSLANRIARYAAFECTADLSHLTEKERASLKQLVQAGKLLDQLYLRQAWSGNEALQKKLQEQGDREKMLLFDMYKGPWASEDDDVPFIEGVPARPKGGNFYPEDMTKPEFEAWLTTLSEQDQKEAKSFYTAIRRDDSTRKLTYVPYSEQYKDLLGPIAEHFHQAAAGLTSTEPEVANFLQSRADAFRSNDYLPSELNWLKLKKTKFEITAGPYEVYTDALFGYKSAYEFYIHLRDEESSRLLDIFSDLQSVEDHLPVPDKYRNPHLVPAPISVVNQLFSAGDVAVPMTAAYNLPNDEEAIKHGGSKLVLIKNVQEGKFKHILTPIAHVVLAKDQLSYLESEAFTTHILLHEVCHSNGPHYTLDGEKVHAKLQEHHSAMEEAKADIAGLFAAALMVRQGKIKNVCTKEFWVTFLASAFRSIRFGIQEAHGLGQACQLNYLIEKGGCQVDPETNLFRVNFEKMEQAVSDLTHDILVLQGDGDKQAVTDFINKYGKLDEHVTRALDRIEAAGIPVDIRPIYPLANQ